MRKTISLILVFSILLTTGNVFARERKGADLYIQKKNGHYERGELIAVKPNSILLLDRYSGVDVTIDIGEIDLFRIERKSLAREGAYIGLFLGVTAGLLSAEREVEKEQKKNNLIVGMFAPGVYLVYGLLYGLAGLIIGGISGKLISANSIIKFEGKSESEIQEILEKLRKKARVKNAQ